MVKFSLSGILGKVMPVEADRRSTPDAPEVYSAASWDFEASVACRNYERQERPPYHISILQ